MVFGFWYYYITQVVSGVKIIPSRFGVIVVSSVPERVDIGDMGRVVGHIVPAAVGDLPVVPPRVVHILRNKRTRCIPDPHHIPLQVLVLLILLYRFCTIKFNIYLNINFKELYVVFDKSNSIK